MIIAFYNYKLHFGTASEDNVLLTRIKCNSGVFCYNKGDFSVLAFSWLGLTQNFIWT